jgi:hypothetical protein
MSEKIESFPIVLVRWADAHAGDSGWLPLDDYEDDGEVIVTTVGYLVPADTPGGKKDHVTVWQTITDGEGIHPFHIPSLMVRSMSVVSFTENPVPDLDTPPV